MLLRYRAQDFAPIAYRDGATPGWPFAYDELEPWYASPRSSTTCAARSVSIRPSRSTPRPILSAPCPDEPAIAKVRERMKRVGLHPFPLPLGVDIDKWLARAKTPWDAFPDTGTGKMDAETCGLSKALAHPNVELRENARVERLLMGPDGKRVTGVEVSDCRGAQKRYPPARHPCRGRGEFGALCCWPRARVASPTAPTWSAGIS